MLHLYRGRNTRSLAREDLDEFLEHHFETCPGCKKELEHLARPASADLEVKPDSCLGPAERWRLERPAWARLHAESVAEANDLVALPRGERRLEALSVDRQYRSPALVDLLLDESRARVVADPLDALEVAECAQTIALRLSRTSVPRALALTSLARAEAYRGNALRVLGHLDQSELILRAALALFDLEGTGDPLVEGEIMELLASLERDQQRYVDAEACLARAQGAYLEAREPCRLQRVCVLKGNLLFETGNVLRALEVDREALAAIDQRREPWLYLCAAHNALDCLLLLEEFDQARASIAQHRELYDRFGHSTINLRRVWIEGHIDRLEGRLADAEVKYSKVREGFLKKGMRSDAASVSRDLILVHHDLAGSAVAGHLRDILTGF